MRRTLADRDPEWAEFLRSSAYRAARLRVLLWDERAYRALITEQAEWMDPTALTIVLREHMGEL